MTTAEIQREVARSTVERARTVLGLNDPEIAKITGTNRRTIRRWADRVSAPRRSHRERMEDIREITNLAEKAFRTGEAARRWIRTPVPAFNDRTPVSLILRGDTGEVIGVLSGLLSGAHT